MFGFGSSVFFHILTNVWVRQKLDYWFRHSVFPRVNISLGDFLLALMCLIQKVTL